jgi:hypothetical protein
MVCFCLLSSKRVGICCQINSDFEYGHVIETDGVAATTTFLIMMIMGWEIWAVRYRSNNRK